MFQQQQQQKKKKKESSAVDRQIFRFGIAFVALIVIDAVRPTPQIVAMILSLLLEEKGVTELKRLAQMDIVVVDAAESGCRSRGGNRHVIPTANGQFFFKRFRQILRDQLIGWRR